MNISEKLLSEILSEIKGIKQEITEFKQEMTEFKQEMNGFKQQTNERLERIEQNMATKQDIETIFAEQQKGVLTILKIMDSKIDDISVNQESISEILGRHEVQIMTLRKRPV